MRTTGRANENIEAERAEREATAWFVRLNDRKPSRSDCRAFDEWLRVDSGNGQAYERVRLLWDDLREPAERLGAGGWYRVPTRQHAYRRPAIRFAAMAAAMLAIVVVTMLWRDPGLPDRAFADYATPPGQTREIELADGSTLFLDGGSAVDVSMTGQARDIYLLRGRAYFDVTHDETRPFLVHSGTVETRVLGTAFAVEQNKENVEVTVARGLVSVAEGGSSRRLRAGQAVAVTVTGPGAVETVDPELALSWRRGLIILDRAPLGAVVDELERMSAGRVVIADQSLRQLRLSGVFQADDADAVLEAMRTGLGLKVLSAPGFVTLIYG
ncbi:UNVERIFIED_ORG: FecR family protein [Martelella mediterranea]